MSASAMAQWVLGNFQYGDHNNSPVNVGAIMNEYEIITLIYNGKSFRLDLLCFGVYKDIIL